MGCRIAALQKSFPPTEGFGLADVLLVGGLKDSDRLGTPPCLGAKVAAQQFDKRVDDSGVQ